MTTPFMQSQTTSDFETRPRTTGVTFGARIVAVAMAMLMAGMLTACCFGQVKDSKQAPDTRGITWSANWFPLSAGDVWVYDYEIKRGASVTKQTRVKWAHASKQYPGQMDLLDLESDSYYLTSDYANGWQLHGEWEVADPDHFHLFVPAMTYLNKEIMEKGVRKDRHKVIDEGGKPTGTIVETTARVIGWESISVPALGERKIRALRTSFQYLVEGGVTFDADNWLVEGVGNVRRVMTLVNPGGRVGFTVSMDLMAARVGKQVLPESNPDQLAALVFRHAWERRERFSDGFLGLKAEFECKKDGAVLGTAKVEVSAAGRATCDVSALPSEERDAAMGVLMMQFGHRRPRDFETSHANHVFKLGTTKGPGIAVDVEGDSMGSRYVVNNSSLLVVSRKDRTGGGRQDVVVEDVLWTNRKYRPSKFRVDYSDESGKIAKVVTYTNGYRRVSGEYIPSDLSFTDSGVTRSYTLGVCEVVKAEEKK